MHMCFNILTYQYEQVYFLFHTYLYIFMCPSAEEQTTHEASITIR